MTQQVAPDDGLVAEREFRTWIAAAVESDPERNLLVDQGYQAWCAWAAHRGGLAILNRRWFTQQMRACGYAAHTFRSGGGSAYLGCRLRPTAQILASADRP